MRMKIISNGLTYVGKNTDETTSADSSNVMFDNLGRMDVLHFELANGDFLVLGKDALQSAHLIFEK